MYKILSITSELKIGSRKYTINIKFEDSRERTVLVVSKQNMNYDYLVSTLIKTRYNDNKVQAIINNYLLDSDDENIIKEFNEMQEWRKISKQIAKEILTSAN